MRISLQLKRAGLTPPCVGVVKGEGLLCGHHMELMPLEGREVRIAAAGRHDAGTHAVGCGHCCGIGDGAALQVGAIMWLTWSSCTAVRGCQSSRQFDEGWPCAMPQAVAAA